jgi:SAM-dependent methyltransferase
MANAEQIEYWNGEGGLRWAQEDARMARLLHPIAEALLDHIRPTHGATALDIGCGGGSQSVLLAERLGGTGRVIGVDISGPLLEVARAKITQGFPEYADLSFLQADAANHRFEPDSVDLLFSRFGVMFFDDPVAAFSNLRSALRGDGRVGFCCWQAPKDNAWAALPIQAALQHVPAPPKPDPHAPGPFAFADPERVRGILTDSGFAGVELKPFNIDMLFGDRDSLRENVVELLGIGPVARLLADASPETRAAVVDSVVEALEPFYTDGALRMPASVWLVTAVAG